jgi:hypothetical protein
MLERREGDFAMRPLVCLILGAMLLTVVAVSGGCAQPKSPPRPKAAPKPALVLQGPPAPEPPPRPLHPLPAEVETDAAGATISVPAIGKSEDDARQVALRNARAEVMNYLNHTYGDIGWEPTIEFLTREGVVKLDSPQLVVVQGEDEKRFGVVARIDWSWEQMKKMQEQVNRAQGKAVESVVWSRLILSARVLAGLLVLALVLAAYIRLEEATRGYYTVLLRLAAGGVVTLAAVGLIFLFQ